MTRRFVMVGLVFSLTVWGHQPVRAVEKNGQVLVIGAPARTSEDFIPMALEAGHEVNPAWLAATRGQDRA